MYEIAAKLLMKRSIVPGLVCLNLAGGTTSMLRNTQQRFWLAVFNECFAL